MPLLFKFFSRATGALVIASLTLLTGCLGTGSNGPHIVAYNPIVVENLKPGDASWKLVSAATNHEIEGYASATSVNRGEGIDFFVSTTDPAYSLSVYRMGWYNGTGARLVLSPVTLSGRQQPIPSPDPVTGLVECNWQSSFHLDVPANPKDPTDWASGVYLVKLTGQSSHKQAYMIFVVRDDARRADLLLQSSVNTYEAYNNWGGMSLYSVPRAVEVSFNRPYRDWYGTQDFFRFEYNMIRFLEREGYDVAYATDVDTHEHSEQILAHKGMLIVGHDEYWSWQMRDNVETARDKGTNLAFFAANTSYWQIRYQPSPVTGAADRTIICYKYSALTSDPYALDTNPNNDYLITTRFRQAPVSRPEDDMVGAMYNESADTGFIKTSMVVSDPSSWIFGNTGLQKGSPLGGLLGYEVDQMFPNVPPGVASVAHSPYVDPADGQTRYSDMTVYRAPSGARVIDTGSMEWNWGLDSFAPGRLHPDLTSPAAQQATRNILNRFGAVAGTPQSST